VILHFSCLLTHVCRMSNAVCFLCHVCVEYTIRIRGQQNPHIFSIGFVVHCGSLIVLLSTFVVDVVPGHPCLLNDAYEGLRSSGLLSDVVPGHPCRLNDAYEGLRSTGSLSVLLSTFVVDVVPGHPCLLNDAYEGLRSLGLLSDVVPGHPCRLNDA
jgi:hypothetical protein